MAALVVVLAAGCGALTVLLLSAGNAGIEALYGALVGAVLAAVPLGAIGWQVHRQRRRRRTMADAGRQTGQPHPDGALCPGSTREL